MRAGELAHAPLELSGTGEQQPAERMVLQVVPDAGQIEVWRDVQRAQLGGIPDAGSIQSTYLAVSLGMITPDAFW